MQKEVKVSKKEEKHKVKAEFTDGYLVDLGQLGLVVSSLEAYEKHMRSPLRVDV